MKNSEISFRLSATATWMAALGLVWHVAAGAQPSVPAVQAPSAGEARQSLSLKDFVNQLRVTNKAIRSKQAESRIAATGIERAEGAFQPMVNASAMRGRSLTKNTFEETLIREKQGVYDRTANDYSLGVSQLISTGAKVELKTSLSQFISNVNSQQPLRPDGAYDNRSQYGVTVTQPLLRDAGSQVTLARLDVAKLDASVADHTARDTEIGAVAEAAIAYHELTFAQHRVQAAHSRIRNAQRLLQEAQAMRRSGRLPDADVWEVENALGRYQAGLSEAQQLERERTNRLRTMLMTAVGKDAAGMTTVDGLPEVRQTVFKADDSLRTALQRREDFLMRKEQIERENVQLTYSRNQLLPRADLVASYGLGALEYSAREAFFASRAMDYPVWSLGMQMSFPLGRNKQGQADIEAAEVRREDAQLALQALEVQIANDIDTSLSMLRSAAENWQLWSEVHEREKKQLEAERRKFGAGRSDTREVLLREERVINSQLNVREQQLAFARAELLLEAAQGTLLDRFR